MPNLDIFAFHRGSGRATNNVRDHNQIWVLILSELPSIH